MKRSHIAIVLCFSVFNISYAQYGSVEKTNCIISQIQQIDLKIMMNNIIVKAQYDSIRTGKDKWFTNNRYFQSITREIPNAIREVVSKSKKADVFQFGSLDLSNYTQANYNALFLYNLIDQTIKYKMKGGKDVVHLFYNTRNIIANNFCNIDSIKLTKSMCDIWAYNNALKIVNIVDKLQWIKERINLARQGKSNVALGFTSYITNSSDLQYNIKRIDDEIVFSLPSLDYFLVKDIQKNIDRIELCFKQINGVVKLDRKETFNKMIEHNKIVMDNRKKYFNDRRTYPKYEVFCNNDEKKYFPDKKVLTVSDELEVEERLRRMEDDFSLSEIWINDEMLKKIAMQIGIEIYDE